jgi:branched-chain amino acid transport system ATP-binding protein
MSTQPVLEIESLNVYYDAIHAIKGISLTVEPGEIVTMIGANGAGKSTTLRTISGLVRPRSGSIRFTGREISEWEPHEIVAAGISHVPEGRRIFANISVRENLELGAYARTEKASKRDDLEKVYLLFPRLKERAKQSGGTLSGGEQQMLAIGRAMMAKPKLLLMDEPSLGLAPTLVRDIFRTIAEINESGTTVLLVEQNARAALQIAQRGYVFETGRITLSDKAAALLDNEQVKAAYLGGD